MEWNHELGKRAADGTFGFKLSEISATSPQGVGLNRMGSSTITSSLRIYKNWYARCCIFICLYWAPSNRITMVLLVFGSVPSRTDPLSLNKGDNGATHAWLNRELVK